MFFFEHNFYPGVKLHILTTRCRTEVRRNFFTNRVAEKWNKLPEYIKGAGNIKTFKYLYDKVPDSRNEKTMSKMLDTNRRHLYAPIWWQIYKYSKEYGRILENISKNHPLAGKMIFYNLGEINENWTSKGVIGHQKAWFFFYILILFKHKFLYFPRWRQW